MLRRKKQCQNETWFIIHSCINMAAPLQFCHPSHMYTHKHTHLWVDMPLQKSCEDKQLCILDAWKQNLAMVQNTIFQHSEKNASFPVEVLDCLVGSFFDLLYLELKVPLPPFYPFPFLIQQLFMICQARVPGRKRMHLTSGLLNLCFNLPAGLSFSCCLGLVSLLLTQYGSQMEWSFEPRRNRQAFPNRKRGTFFSLVFPLGPKGKKKEHTWERRKIGWVAHSGSPIED